MGEGLGFRLAALGFGAFLGALLFKIYGPLFGASGIGLREKYSGNKVERSFRDPTL